MHTDKSPGHGRVARQEQRLPLLDEAGEAIADRIGAEVGTIVANAHHDNGWLVGTYNKEVSNILYKFATGNTSSLRF